MTPERVTRRTFLGAAGAASAISVAGAPESNAAGVLPSDPFMVGVASGDVTPSAVVLWTRLTTDPTAPDLGMEGQGIIPVEWRLATTPEGLESSSEALRVGTAAARPAHGWAVHVDVRGLEPGSTYWYQFRVAGWVTAPARTRTAPAVGADSTATFAVVSCQNLARPGRGRFHLNGVRHIAARDDLDFVVHLGDYIYDFGRAGHIPSRQIVSLSDYRQRYGQYKGDEALRAMHAAHPVFAVPDDHELFNNVFGGDPEMSEEDREHFNVAMQAYWENMPFRGGPPRLNPLTNTANLQTYRRIQWGSVLDLLMVDNRQFRTPVSTILGEEQLAWLADALSTSGAHWTAIGSGVPMSWFPNFPGSGDKWTGYDRDRSLITDVLADRLAARSTAAFNPVVLSGDVHRGIVTHVRQRQDAVSPLVATEFIGPPMTSNNGRLFATDADAGAFRAEYAFGTAPVNSYRGYLACAVTPDAWTSTFVLGQDVESPEGTVEPFESWRLAAGADPGAVVRAPVG